MDERFFLYGEEIDLCHRIKHAGWEILHVPTMTIRHPWDREGFDARLEAQHAFARRQYMEKHFSRPRLALGLFALGLGYAVRSVVAGAIRRPVEGADARRGRPFGRCSGWRPRHFAGRLARQCQLVSRMSSRLEPGGPIEQATAGSTARPLRAVLYHHVAEQPSSLFNRLAVNTPPDVFEAHVRKIARDYNVVSLDDVLSGRLPRRALLITFDDGYRSVVEVALPILRRLGLPSAFFVTGACLERDSLPLDNLLSHLCASVGLDRLGTAVDPETDGTGTFAQLLGLVAALPYGRSLRLGDELAERFDVDQAEVRAASGLFLEPEDLAGLAALGCEVGTIRARTCSAARSLTRDPLTTSSSSMLASSSR